MIVSPYGTGQLDSTRLVESAGFFLASMAEAALNDKRNAKLKPFGRWLKYRHELRDTVDGVPVDRWQAPYETEKSRIGDCEDMSVYWLCAPPFNGEFEPAVLGVHNTLVHAVVADWSRPHIWMSDDDTELYIDRVGFVRKGDCGLIDTSWLTGMPHPLGRRFKGHDRSNPKYCFGVSRCTPESDIRDRMKDMQWRQTVDGMGNYPVRLRYG